MVWTNWLEALIAFNAHQRHVDNLGRLSDRLLDDIGLRRDQLDALRLEAPASDGPAHRQAWGKRAFAELGGQVSLKGCG